MRNISFQNWETLATKLHAFKFLGKHIWFLESDLFFYNNVPGRGQTGTLTGNNMFASLLRAEVCRSIFQPSMRSNSSNYGHVPDN